MSGGDVTAVVIDNGTDTCKVGFAGDQKPRCLMPAVVGRNEHHGHGLALGPTKDFYVGFEALSRRAVVNLSHPVQRGLVTSWEDMHTVWEHAYTDELCVESKDHPVLISETPGTPRENRDKMAEVLYETLHVPALCVASPAVMCMYSSGQTTGTVLDIGAGLTRAVAVHEGRPVSGALVSQDMAGSDITRFLYRLVTEKEVNASIQTDHAHMELIKEQLGYVALDFNKEFKKMTKGHRKAPAEEAVNTTYELPDGQIIKIASERFRCAEALFQPKLIDRPNLLGLHKMVHTVIGQCDSDIRKSLWSHVVLSGGSSMFEGLSARLEQELAKLKPIGSKVKLSVHEDRIASAWIGGSVFASMSTFSDHLVTKEQYQEAGPAVLYKDL
ncbi:actin, plasmodial isoform [Aplysia californica]|uniref:Actin, plasmodial isoform n=1 Tax=Aplysia californica TaxID=6500 RepID=A0ABM0K6U9_APLCA|nr:actin, plasmodial isoform [Aplysia californica]XP_005110121.1 actin, plasmodial isoform [Aplysia californica]